MPEGIPPWGTRESIAWRASGIAQAINRAKAKLGAERAAEWDERVAAAQSGEADAADNEGTAGDGSENQRSSVREIDRVANTSTLDQSPGLLERVPRGVKIVGAALLGTAGLVALFSPIPGGRPLGMALEGAAAGLLATATTKPEHNPDQYI